MHLTVIEPFKSTSCHPIHESKRELLEQCNIWKLFSHHHQYQARKKIIETIFEYIEVFYYRERIHSANDYLSPVEYE